MWPQRAPPTRPGYDLALVVADGLSALAVHRHALPMLERIEEQALVEGWSLAPVTLVSSAEPSRAPTKPDSPNP